ncbi:MAG: hypothetical protein K1X53_05930 [Candidatus Sumerlaeaceae bacterium]|nr:hypothetical protein [Candidatus Sumerlaeaceae bacterium]
MGRRRSSRKMQRAARRRRERLRYVFPKPAWRKIVPILFIGFAWSLPFAFRLLDLVESKNLVTHFLRMADEWLHAHGVTEARLKLGAWLVTGIMAVWLYWGLEKLIITPSAIYRRYPFWHTPPIKWRDVDEVAIEHIERLFEGRFTMKKVLDIYSVRPWWLPWRRHIRITNRQYDGYHHAERVAVRVAIPAIARRKRKMMDQDRRPVFFPEVEPYAGRTTLLYFLAGLGALAMWLARGIWPPEIAVLRPLALVAAVLLELIAVARLAYRQIGLDHKYLYIMRRSLVRKRIPLEAITSAMVQDNSLRIKAVMKKGAKPRVVFRASQFFRNRAVMLFMLRRLKEEREAERDALPIVAIPGGLASRPVPPTPLSKRMAPPAPAPAEAEESAPVPVVSAPEQSGEVIPESGPGEVEPGKPPAPQPDALGQ